MTRHSGPARLDTPLGKPTRGWLYGGLKDSWSTVRDEWVTKSLRSRSPLQAGEQEAVCGMQDSMHVCMLICVWLLCDPMDYSLQGFSVHGILQARIWGCNAIPFSRGSSQPKDWTHSSCVSCIFRQILYHATTWEAQVSMIMASQRYSGPNSQDLWRCDLHGKRDLQIWLRILIGGADPVLIRWAYSSHRGLYERKRVREWGVT